MPFLFSLQIASSSTSARPTLPCVSSSSTLPEDHEYAGHYKLVDGIQPARCWRRCLWNQNRFCPCSEHRQKHDAEEGACAINIDWSHPQHIHVNIFINLHACTCMVKTDVTNVFVSLFHSSFCCQHHPHIFTWERTLLKTLMMTRKRMTRRDILPGITFKRKN